MFYNKPFAPSHPLVYTMKRFLDNRVLFSPTVFAECTSTFDFFPTFMTMHILPSSILVFSHNDYNIEHQYLLIFHNYRNKAVYP